MTARGPLRRMPCVRNIIVDESGVDFCLCWVQTVWVTQTAGVMCRRVTAKGNRPGLHTGRSQVEAAVYRLSARMS
jgi:hypothetical protein